MDISIIVIGDELLIGQVTDTNSGWIARHINPIGWNVKSIKVIGDNETEILKAIEECFAQTDLVLTTGGLGPTKDDITKEAMRKYFGGKMIFDAEVENQFVEFGKIAMILFYRRIHGLTETAKQIFNLRFGKLI